MASSNSNAVSNTLKQATTEITHALPLTNFNLTLALADLDPATAKLAIGFLGPFLSVFGFLFILRIVMSWYPKLPVGKFPYVIAYAPTEPLLVQTRKVIPPLAGVDVTPVVWFGLLSFLMRYWWDLKGCLFFFLSKSIRLHMWDLGA
ncbi:protein COFACTOR ASSEMBLY OF COMPLEX C SUBUNIT B CCB3, chloroplastic-like [Neltuma alba]|uniref:protein COFACTOR ASSEMBLY OF COMPLEX C SUBUNIT B CCB3, chloroplastic-like n=1 Tax=Neltuma alba TaxID=207710 RepID=UPI0010A3A796|nr:protein COFACTOR ASSEMBLY OF COMPLEX C SUBUNIT B CCB3, chloroplastic-like [Prosopis alba]